MLKSLGPLIDEVTEARAKAKAEAKRDCGKGFPRSRGAWIIVRFPGEQEPSITNGG